MKDNTNKKQPYRPSHLARKIIELIKQELSVIEVAGEFTDLKNLGGKFTGTCPFCAEATKSFDVFPVSQTYHCSQCRKQGDVFQFLMDIDQVSFRDAFKIIISRHCGL